MINETNVALGQVRSVIRELFEYGKRRKAEIGEDKVFDFSLGNPSVPAPEAVKTALLDLIENGDPVFLHGYTSAQGDKTVRDTIAKSINDRFNTKIDGDCIYMTCGAAASLCITLNALLNKGEEVITFAPFFPEYSVFTAHAGGTLIPVPSRESDFQPDLKAFENALNDKTKAVIINSPNNPSGVVYGEETIETLCAILKKYERKTGRQIYLISDEPYRELVFDDDCKVPYIMNYYDRSLVCYSYSKSLSLPGERIGYIAVNNAMSEFSEVYAGVCGAGRALGYVCAPNLFQQLVARVNGKTSDISVYRRNRDTLCEALTSFGYKVVKPDGAFYLFVKAFGGDASKFSERAKRYNLLLVPSDSFGVKGYVRIAYCVSYEAIINSLPAFKALAESYK